MLPIRRSVPVTRIAACEQALLEALFGRLLEEGDPPSFDWTVDDGESRHGILLVARWQPGDVRV